MTEVAGTVLSAEDVSVRYGRIEALRGFSVVLERGRLTGLIGPDGAGKTTAIRAMVGLLAPSSGSIDLAGSPLGSSRARLARTVGYMPQRFSLYVDLTIDENITFFARLHGTKGERDQHDSLLHKMGLAPFRRRLAGKLSGGMKQKLALLCVLVHEPSLIIMDEPTTGVDPVSRREFWRILGELASQGMSILVATPYLDEAERCHEVLLMHEGNTILRGDPDDLVRTASRAVFEVPSTDTFSLKQAIQSKPWVRTAQAFGSSLHLTCTDPATNAASVDRLLASTGVAATATRVEPTLEDVFIEAVMG